jgi:hypothetical protein
VRRRLGADAAGARTGAPSERAETSGGDQQQVADEHGGRPARAIVFSRDASADAVRVCGFVGQVGGDATTRRSRVES